MNTKQNHKFSKYHPSTHLYQILSLAFVTIGVASLIFFVYWVSISKTATNVIINPTKEVVAYIYNVFPKEMIIEVWEQQLVIWSLFIKGFQELVRSFSLF